MLAIHAWRSAGAIAQYRKAFPTGPLILCLAGTDIYRFQESHPEETQRSMEFADSLVCLHDLVGRSIPKSQRSKLHVIRQSAAPLKRQAPVAREFEIMVAGHLRDEKDPFRAAMAVRSLDTRYKTQIVHMGKAIDPSFAEAATAEMRENARYRWLGEIPRWRVRQRMARARAMVISSRMEGGANVVSEAIMAGLPVIASKIDGNVGLLGADYEGYYPVENEGSLRALLMRLEDEPNFLKRLDAQIRALKPMFTEKRELTEWKGVLSSLNRPT
jgi:putative glycosyltransferase (TIGR04348 family)